MRSEGDTKKWGTIYLGGNKEATLESIDAMQAAARQEQWNQRTQNDYLDRVRERATDRAREILGAAHTERQAILDEARADAERIRLETQVQYDNADRALADAAATRAAAQALHDAAETIRNAAQEEGFNTGLANASDELDAFRGAMGASIAMVLQSIERQNAAIFSAWREEIVALVHTCVNKGTEWVLDDQHAAVLRALVMESVRQLDNRHTVTLRVHPDDEAAVADMFAAAREAMPDVNRWIVQGDPSVALGGLVAESPSSMVDNRVGLRNALVEGILQHLTLPEGEAEVIAAQAIHDVIREQVTHIETLAPPVSEQYLPDHADQNPEQSPDQEPEQAEMPIAAPMVDPVPIEVSQGLDHLADAPPSEADAPDMVAIPDMLTLTAELLADAGGETPPEPSTDATATLNIEPDIDLDPGEQPIHEYTPLPAPLAPIESAQQEDAAHAPSSLADLEEELIPLPEENSDAVNAVLAGGGFLSDDDTLGPRS